MNWSVSLQGSAKGRRGTVKRGTMFKLLLCTLAVSYVSAAPVTVDNIGVNTTTVVAQPVCKDSHPGGNPRKCDLSCFSECCGNADDYSPAQLAECIDKDCGCAGFPSESCVCPTCDVTPGQSCTEDRDCDRAPGCGQRPHRRRRLIARDPARATPTAAATAPVAVLSSARHLSRLAIMPVNPQWSCLQPLLHNTNRLQCFRIRAKISLDAVAFLARVMLTAATCACAVYKKLITIAWVVRAMQLSCD